jgi:hypothetical protein
MDLKWAGTHESRFQRPQGRPREIRRKRFRDRLHCLRRLHHAEAPLRQNGRDPVVIFFKRKAVETGLCLDERGIQGDLGTVVRMQVELALTYGLTVRIEGVDRR